MVSLYKQISGLQPEKEAIMKTLIRNARYFDGTQDQIHPQSNFVLENGKITEIFQGDCSIEAFDAVLDAEGYTVIPGLVDSHIHFSFTAPVPVCATYRYDEFVLRSARYAQEMLMRGITSARDAGGVTVGLKNCIDNGMLQGPRIFPSNGAIVQTSGHDASVYYSDAELPGNRANAVMRSGMFVYADGADAVLKAARQQLFLGASQIKIMAGGGMGSVFDPLYTVQFTPEEIRAAVQVAKDYGTYVMAHLYIPQSIDRALDAGVMSYEHATLMNEDNARRIREAGAWICVCPQFGGNGGMPVKRSKPYPTAMGTPVVKFKPDRSVMAEGLLHQAELINKYDLNFVFGTDQFREEWADDEPCDRQLADLRRYKEFFGNYRGLKAATGNASRLSQLTTYQNPYPDGKIGVLEEGAFADLLFVDGNPLEDLEILCDPNNIKLVMKGGKIFRDDR